MIKNQRIGLGDFLATETERFFNRTGAALKKGEAAMVDLAQSHSAVDTTEPGKENGVNANVITCTQDGINHGRSIPLAAEDIPDGKLGRFILYGTNVDIMALNNGDATTNVAKGLGISIVVSDSAVASQTYATARRNLGQWYEDGHATVTQLKKGQWTGGMPSLGCGL